MQTTANYGLQKPETTDTFNPMAVTDANMDKIDTQMKANADAAAAAQQTANDATAAGAATDNVIGSRTADPSQAPAGLTGSLTQWVSWFVNRIKAITGTVNWYDAPPTTLTAANTHMSNMNNPHNVQPAQIGAVPTSDKGAAGGVATLDNTTHIPSAQIPVATSTTLGGVKQGSYISVGGDGTITVTGAVAKTDTAQTWTAVQTWAAGQTFAWSAITGTPTTLSGYGISDAIPASQKGANSGVASLDSSGQVPANQLGNVPPAGITNNVAAWIG